MWETVFKWINDNYPILGLIIIVSAIVWLISAKYFKWTYKIESNEKDCTTITTDFKILTTSITNIATSFNSLIVYLKSKDGNMDTSLFVSRSPIQLSELGTRILNTTGGNNFIDSYLGELMKSMDAYNINTALDAQNFSPIVISSFTTKDSFKAIKDFIYKNPFYKEKNNEGEELSVPLDISTVVNIMGIYLRDKYLEKHPNLDPKELAA
jgi:hypothetical protein